MENNLKKSIYIYMCVCVCVCVCVFEMLKSEGQYQTLPVKEGTKIQTKKYVDFGLSRILTRVPRLYSG